MDLVACQKSLPLRPVGCPSARVAGSVTAIQHAIPRALLPAARRLPPPPLPIGQGSSTPQLAPSTHRLRQAPARDLHPAVIAIRPAIRRAIPPTLALSRYRRIACALRPDRCSSRGAYIQPDTTPSLRRGALPVVPPPVPCEGRELTRDRRPGGVGGRMLHTEQLTAIRRAIQSAVCRTTHSHRAGDRRPRRSTAGQPS